MTCDGLTGAIQERMKAEHKTKSNHMMTNMNMWSVLILGIALLVTGELFEFLGMISHKKSLITIFGHNHGIKNFIKKFNIFHENF